MSVIGVSILIFPFFVEVLEASPTGKVSREVTKKSVSCPKMRLICPTSEEHFVVHYSRGRSRRQCEVGSILDRALEVCNISIMQHCMDIWVAKNDNCTIPISILRRILDPVFRGPCSLHDLCYLSLNAKRDECDKWFLHNLKQICNTKSFFARLVCKGTAYLMYGAVRQFGGSYFVAGQKWAKDNCIPKSSELENSGSAKGFGSGAFGSGSGYLDLEVGDLEVGDIEVGDLEVENPE